MPANISISFPYLGIELENLKNSFSVFGVDIAYYGVIIGIGMLAAMMLAFRDARLSGQNVDDYMDLAIYGIIFAIVGARLYYVFFEWDYYKQHLGEIINLRKGGLAIYGGIIGGVIVCIVLARIKKLSFWKMLDTGGIGLITGQMIGRWGNFFNREAYGGDTNSLFAMRINVNDPNVTVNVQNGVTVIDNSYIQVHPTFLYESIWCLCILTGLQLCKRKKKFQGEVFLWYITAYAFGRFFIEGLRTDQLHIHGTQIPVSQVLSAVLFLAGLFLIVYNRLRIARGMQTVVVGAKVTKPYAGYPPMRFQSDANIRKAMKFAEKAHQNQTWKLFDGTEVSYFEGHLMGVYQVVKDLSEHSDEEMLVTALLHDVLEDTEFTYQDIADRFGTTVANNVLWLTKPKDYSYNKYVDRLLEGGSDTAVVVKLADRRFNMVNLMNQGSEEWHRKKIDEAKYMLNVVEKRKLAPKYEKMKQQLLETIAADVEQAVK